MELSTKERFNRKRVNIYGLIFVVHFLPLLPNTRFRLVHDIFRKTLLHRASGDCRANLQRIDATDCHHTGLAMMKLERTAAQRTSAWNTRAARL